MKGFKPLTTKVLIEADIEVRSGKAKEATNIYYSWNNCKYFATLSTNSILDLSSQNLMAESHRNRVQTTSVL
jgi:hypothetical protein